MKIRGKIKIVTLTMAFVLILSACKSKEERYELTNYVGSSAVTFEKRSGIDLEEQSNGVYLMKDVAQVMVTGKDVTSIKLMNQAGDYMLFGVKIGMSRTEVEQLLAGIFGKEIAKTNNSTNNTVMYTYLKDDKELYITFDQEKETVIDISYYKVEASREEEKEAENSGELMIMIGDERVYYNEAMVYLKSVQKNYEADYGKNIWDVDLMGNGETFGDLIKDEVVKQITELKVIRDKAKEMNINLSEEELADAHGYAKEHYEGLTEEDIDQYLVTRELLEQVYEENMLADKVFETLTINVDTNVSDIESKQITVWHILINSVDYDEEGNKVELSAEAKEAAYDKVVSLLEQAKETEDFYALAEANSQADTIEYTFGRGKGPSEYSSAFEQASFTLKTGQVSNIITTDYGWHIIYCVTDFNEDATIQVKENIIDQRRNKIFSNNYKEWSANYDVVVNSEAWDKVSYAD